MRLEIDRRTGRDEAVGLHLAVVDHLDHGRVGQDRAERLHHVERERRPAEARPVVEAEIGIEADRREHGEPGARQQRIAERQHGVDRIGRRAAGALVEGELGKVARRLAEHGGEQAEVARRRLALDAEQLGFGRRVHGAVGEARQRLERRVALGFIRRP